MNRRPNQGQPRDNLNNQMSSKLSELFKISQKNENRHREQRHQVSSRNLPALRQDSVDGVDHINFFTDVQTELGALLSTENRLPFKFVDPNNPNNEECMQFESIKCLWAYYRTSCTVEGFKNAPDYKIRRLYRVINEYPKQESVFAVLVLGYYSKMLAYPALAEAVVNTNLPFEYYSVREGVKKRTSVSKLMINALYEVRRSLKHNAPLRLESFLSKDDQHRVSTIFQGFRQSYIINVLLREDAFRESYAKAIAKATPEDLAKLKFDLTDPPKAAGPGSQKSVVLSSLPVAPVPDIAESILSDLNDEDFLSGSITDPENTDLEIKSVSEEATLPSVELNPSTEQ